MKRQKSAAFAESRDKYANNKNYCKVRDHCYYTGKQRGPAHSISNLRYSIPNKVPVIFHNI